MLTIVSHFRIKLVIYLCAIIGSAPSWSKPVDLVEAVNTLVSTPKGSDLAVVSPSAAFFTLVMLEHMADSQTGEYLRTITRSNLWRNDKMSAELTTGGWQKLNNEWWISEWVKPTPHFFSSASHFKTKIHISSLREVSSTPPWSGFLGKNTLSSLAEGSLLWTEASFSPLFKGGLSKVPSSMVDFENSASVIKKVPYLQTSIISGRLRRDAEGDVEVIIPLAGNGTLVLKVGHIEESSGEQTESPIILFIPEMKLVSHCRPIEVYGWPELSSGLRDYGKYTDGRRLELSEWVMKSTVDFSPHPAPLEEQISKEVSYSDPPIVVKVDRPFSFEIRGSHQEKLFEGVVEYHHLKKE